MNPVVTDWCLPGCLYCRPLKAQLHAELGTAADSDAQDQIRDAFAAREKAIEHDLDHKPLDVHLMLDVSYNFLSK